MIKGTLYLVPTPIGNLDDMTYRAVTTLQSVSVIFAEDTRTSKKLLQHFDITTQLESYHKFNEKSRVGRILHLLSEGQDVAIISDAGSPGISDPSQIIVKEAINENYSIVSLPGATAFVPALTASGLSSDTFSFWGFLPTKKIRRDELLASLKQREETLIFYVAVHDIQKTISYLFSAFGNRSIAIGREISKKFETYYYGTLESFSSDSNFTLKGEFVFVVEGQQKKEYECIDLESEIKKRLKENMHVKEICKALQNRTKMNKKEIYNLTLKIKKQGD